MRNSSLLPLLRSRTQGELLALTFLHPDREYTLTEAARLVGTSVKTIHTEAERLVRAGLLLDRRVGAARLIRAETNSLLARPLTDLLAVTYGPLPVLTDALTGLPGLEHAYIYGSWAARYSGEPGPPPADVDVLAVGTTDPDLLEDAARSVEARLGRDVSIRRIRPEAWTTRDRDDAFLASVRARPLVELQIHVEKEEEE